MVKGIDIFQEYFKEYTAQYVLIFQNLCPSLFQNATLQEKG